MGGSSTNIPTTRRSNALLSGDQSQLLGKYVLYYIACARIVMQRGRSRFANTRHWILELYFSPVKFLIKWIADKKLLRASRNAESDRQLSEKWHFQDNFEKREARSRIVSSHQRFSIMHISYKWLARVGRDIKLWSFFGTPPIWRAVICHCQSIPFYNFSCRLYVK